MSENFGRVGVLYGGRSAEREVSLMSGQGVHEALRSAGVDAHLFDTGRYTLVDLIGAGFDRVFIALHGRHGEDGTLQGALELLQLPYPGSGPLASTLAMDKIMTKKVWLQQGLPTPDYAVMTPDSDLDRLAQELGLPLMVKPPHEGSTLGVTRVDELAGLRRGYELAALYADGVMAEQLIYVRQVTVPSLGHGNTAKD